MGYWNEHRGNAKKSEMFCKNCRIFYMSELLASDCQSLQRHLMASGRCTITMSKYLSFNLTVIFQKQYCNKCIFMQSGNFHYLTSGEPTMKSAIGYFQWLQSFQLGTGSNLYIISRRSLGLVRVPRRYSDFKPWPPLLQIFLTASKNSASWNQRSGVISVTQNVKLYFNLNLWYWNL